MNTHNEACYVNPPGPMVERFSQKQQELAAKISNDIAEDIDGGETRKQLRMAVAYWADMANVGAQQAADAMHKLMVSQIDGKTCKCCCLPLNECHER